MNHVDDSQHVNAVKLWFQVISGSFLLIIWSMNNLETSWSQQRNKFSSNQVASGDAELSSIDHNTGTVVNTDRDYIKN